MVYPVVVESASLVKELAYIHVQNRRRDMKGEGAGVKGNWGVSRYGVESTWILTFKMEVASRPNRESAF